MEKKIVVTGVCIFFLTVAFSGCQEKQAAVGQIPENILFESNFLKIANASFTLEKDKTGKIKQAELIVYFKNILDKPINNLTLAIDSVSGRSRRMARSPTDRSRTVRMFILKRSPSRRRCPQDVRG